MGPFLPSRVIPYRAITFVPIGATVELAMIKRGGENLRGLVGLFNLRQTLTDRSSRKTIQKSVCCAVVGGVLLFVPVFLLAWCLSQPIRAKRSFRFIVVMPTVISATGTG
jgi:ABC-type sugar transport system permease subunit